jgi:serine/threonine protein kinase
MKNRLVITALCAGLLLALASAPAEAQRWPGKKSYVNAMYNSHQFIRDPKLRGAKVKRDRRERPIVYSGSFSSVFKVKTTSGRNVALRVFHPEAAVAERQSVTALAQRYGKIHAYLDGLRAKKRLPPEIVEFAFVERGIKIDGESLPIMKLPWVSGRNLDSWIETRLGQGRAKAVALLAENWRAAMRDLHSVKIAHGDLHHGNIMLEPSGAMRLLDYDSMYVPTLAGLSNSEIGHPNFQHPSYHFPARPRPFDHRMDRFSALVIYTSLVAVADNPKLWTRYHNDHNLIFEGERDFVNIDSSPVFRDILASSNPTVRGLARQLIKHAKGRPENVPPLEDVIKAASTPWFKRTQAR